MHLPWYHRYQALVALLTNFDMYLERVVPGISIDRIREVPNARGALDFLSHHYSFVHSKFVMGQGMSFVKVSSANVAVSFAF